MFIPLKNLLEANCPSLRGYGGNLNFLQLRTLLMVSFSDFLDPFQVALVLFIVNKSKLRFDKEGSDLNSDIRVFNCRRYTSFLRLQIAKL
jgi:hypothetical protein